MKKILFYTDTPQIAGAEGIILLLARFLDREKFEPILVCSKYPALDKWCRKFEKEKIRVHRLNVIHKHDPRHYSQLKKIIKMESPDLVHIHVWNPGSCRYAFLATPKNIPIVTTEHDPFTLTKLKSLFKKQTLTRIKKIIAISNDNKKLLKQLHPNHKHKIEVIHNGIDTTWWQSQTLRFSAKDQRKVKKDIFHANEDSLIIICIAELHERKGQKFLIRALPRITEKYPNIKLVLISDGPAKDEYKRLVKKLDLQRHVTLLGRLSPNKIPKLMKSSDIFALPSRREAFGLVNIEAMITGLPVVATKVGGIPEIIKDTGILVPPENTEAFEQALLKLIESPKLREKLAEAGKTKAITFFDAEIMAKKYEKVYNNII